MHIFAAIGLVVALHAGAEVHTWIDEEGKRHFGDSVPPKYAEKAGKVEMNDVNMIDPEPEVERQNRRYRADLERQYRERQDVKRQTQALPQQRQAAEAQPGPESCYARYPHAKDTKARTSCLKRFE